MKKLMRIGFLIFVCTFWMCDRESYEVNYQSGYPNRLAGVWIAYEYPGGDKRTTPYPEYELVSALLPGHSDTLVFSNLYDSKFRVKVAIDSNRFSITRGAQLEVLEHKYDVESITLSGKLIENDEDLDVLNLNVGYYDGYDALVDSVLIIAIRKTGFEETEQYNF